jgi:tetratricopeptide (TPR) repeat protein
VAIRGISRIAEHLGPFLTSASQFHTIQPEPGAHRILSISPNPLHPASFAKRLFIILGESERLLNEEYQGAGMDSRFAKVLKLLDAREFIKAKPILEDLARSDPNNPEVLYNLGMCYSEIGDFEASIKTLEQSLKQKPDTPNILTALSFSYTNVGRFNEAEAVLLKALELEPNNLYAINNLGGLYGKLRKFDLALEIFQRGEANYPDDHRLIYGLALSHQKLGNLARQTHIIEN